ncbi:MAG: TerD family protein [Candidatus Obscuribacter sp.]|nr:TerD family protein [Candidatus Obscuribacter sp.]
MRVPSSRVKICPGVICDLQERAPEARIIKSGFGGYAFERSCSEVLRLDVNCLALGKSCADCYLVGGHRSVMPGGSIRVTENKFAPDEWGECFIIRLDAVPEAVDALIFTGAFTCSSPSGLESGMVREHFLRISDHSRGREVLRAELPDRQLSAETILYARLKRKSDRSGWVFEFVGAPLQETLS